MNLPILSLLVAVPLLGGIAVLFTGRERPAAARWLALLVSLVTFAVSLLMWAGFDATSAEYQLVERHAWLPEFGISYHIGIDGISLLLVVLTTFLTPIALLCSWESVESRVREFSFFMLALEAAMIGVFISLDLFLFYIFWDAMLIPMYFLIGIWGYDRRIYASIKFLLYTMAGSVLMLIAIIWLAYYHQSVTGVPSFDLLDLERVGLDPGRTQTYLFLAFAVAFAIKVPLFPFHTWLPDAHVEAPTAGSVILAGAPEDGHLRPAALRLSAVPGCRARVCAVHRGPGGGGRRVRRARGHGPAGHEKAGGLLVSEPPRHRGARPVCAERERHPGRRLPDAGARHFDRRALPHRRHAV
jgi:NADH-quinone oxidoreductase subunit M